MKGEFYYRKKSNRGKNGKICVEVCHLLVKNQKSIEW